METRLELLIEYTEDELFLMEVLQVRIHLGRAVMESSTT